MFCFKMFQHSEHGWFGISWKFNDCTLIRYYLPERRFFFRKFGSLLDIWGFKISHSWSLKPPGLNWNSTFVWQEDSPMEKTPMFTDGERFFNWRCEEESWIVRHFFCNWLVVSNIFYFHPYLGKWTNLTNIFQMGWNHQPDKVPSFRKNFYVDATFFLDVDDCLWMWIWCT